MTRSPKKYPVFKFNEDGKLNVTYHTNEELKEMKNKNKSKYDSESIQKEKYKELLHKLYKEATTKSNDFMGVEVEVRYNADHKSVEYATMCNSLLFNVLTELESMSYNGHEYVQDEYDESQPFKTEHNVKQYIKRLSKFVVKYAPVYLDTKEEIEYFIKEAKGYM